MRPSKNPAKTKLTPAPPKKVLNLEKDSSSQKQTKLCSKRTWKQNSGYQFRKDCSYLATVSLTGPCNGMQKNAKGTC